MPSDIEPFLHALLATQAESRDFARAAAALREALLRTGLERADVDAFLNATTALLLDQRAGAGSPDVRVRRLLARLLDSSVSPHPVEIEVSEELTGLGRSSKPAEPPTAHAYTVWYGTNRKRADANGSPSFTSQRETDPQTVHYGACDVVVPKSHKFGSVGSAWWRRLLTLTDDRLRLKTMRPSSDAEFWQLIREELARWDEPERQALVYLHGYNVTFQQAAIRAAQIGFDLKVPGVTAFFSWPSRGSAGDYPKDEATIEACEPAITEFLVRFASDVGAKCVHVIAHSMGNRGLLRAVQRIGADAQQRSRVKFGQIFLAAPDVDADLFRQLAAIYPQLAARATLYASPADKAVGLSEWFHGAARAGFTPPITIVPGVDTIEIPNFNLDVLGHGYFAQAAGVLHDMFDLIRRDAAPGDRQRLDPQREQGRPYWTMRA